MADPNRRAVTNRESLALLFIVIAAIGIRLICFSGYNASDDGAYAELAMNVTRNAPYLVLPRGVARLISLNACHYPARINNQFYEYLAFGSGRWPKVLCNSSSCDCVCSDPSVQVYRRSPACTFLDIGTTNKILRIYLGSAADENKRVLVGCRDSNGIAQRQLDGSVLVNGIFVSLTGTFVDLKLPGTTTALEISAITDIQKDITIGPVHFYEVDITTGVHRLLLTMEPGETVACYTSYYLNQLPAGCCSVADATDDTIVQLTAMVKLDLIPVVVDSDYLLIQSREAIRAEVQAGRLAGLDSPGAKLQAAERHREAVRYLNGFTAHMEGTDRPAVNFAPFGSARPSYQKIGTMQ